MRINESGHETSRTRGSEGFQMEANPPETIAVGFARLGPMAVDFLKIVRTQVKQGAIGWRYRRKKKSEKKGNN
jgi:hypothetical protein